MAIKIPDIKPLSPGKLSSKKKPEVKAEKDFGKGTIDSAKKLAEEAGFSSLGDLIGEKSESEKLKNKSVSDGKGKNGGARPGAGRPEGSMNKKTIEDKEAMSYIRERVAKNLDELIGKQLSLSKGIQMLFKIEKVVDKKGNETKSKPILVTAHWEIEKYLDGEYDDDPDADYYFMTTERPDNKAIEALLDRAYGRAKQTMDLGVSKSLEDILRERRLAKEKDA